MRRLDLSLAAKDEALISLVKPVRLPTCKETDLKKLCISRMQSPLCVRCSIVAATQRETCDTKREPQVFLTFGAMDTWLSYSANALNKKHNPTA